MKKITDFLVDKRNIILVIMIIITGVCFYLDTKVTINRDISKYLPASSETRQGMDKMDVEFSDNQVSSLNLMIDDLTKEEKTKIYEELNNLENVSSVDYDDTDKYNKDNHTLYVINMKENADSKLASDLYKKIMDKYQDYKIYTGGDIADENKDVLPLWIVFLAIFCALIILIIMCDSYLEPILFLIAIGLSVFINKGTNIIFPSISSITSAISAILQLALSMDYSIMLMNRYRDEKTREKDNVKAMKKALYSSFLSISSSSVTTIVGLIALVFMSFTIGRDLGLVLAKGVLFSLLTIFTCLPALILMFDKYIIKTKKKRPVFNMDKLGKFAYHFRYYGISLFGIIFIISIIMKGNLGILYTDAETDEVGKIFQTNNQMAIVYNNKYESIINDYCHKLDGNKMIDDVLCYGNTINENLTFDKLNTKLDDLGSSVSIEDYLTKIIYYHYYNPKEDNKINLNSLLNFIKKDVYQNKEMNEKINKTTKNNIDKLINFTDNKLMNSKKTSKDIANIFELDEESVNDLLVYYNSLSTDTKISLSDFVNFLNNFVSSSKYGSNLDLSSLSLISNLSNKDLIMKNAKIEEIANIFGIDKELVGNLFTLKYGSVDNGSTFTLKEIIETSLYLRQNTHYLDDIDLNLLISLSQNSMIMDNNTKFSASNIASLFQIDESKLYLIYAFIDYNNGNIDNWVFTPYEFVQFILSNVDNELISNNINSETINNLKLCENIMNLTLDNTLLDSGSMSSLLGINESDIRLLYSLYDINYLKKDIKLSYYEFIQFLINNVVNNKEYNEALTKDKITKINTINKIMKDSLNKVKYNKEELYNLVTKLTNNLDKNLIDLVYIYYGSVNNYDENYSLSIEEFVNYLNNDIINDTRFNDFLTTERRNNILDSKDTVKDAKELLLGDDYSRAVLNTSYSPEGKETFDFIKNIKNDLQQDDIYVVGNSPMAYDISTTFQKELNFITLLTIIFIFVVVAISFKKFLIPIILVFLIQTAVYLTMGILSFEGGSVYFISLLIVQSILMGATIDYAILYTSYYVESRKTMDIKESVINSYNKSIHTIITSASILSLVTLVVGYFGSEIASKICTTISQGTICSTILILLILPELISSLDRFIIKKDKKITK